MKTTIITDPAERRAFIDKADAAGYSEYCESGSLDLSRSGVVVVAEGPGGLIVEEHDTVEQARASFAARRRALA